MEVLGICLITKLKCIGLIIHNAIEGSTLSLGDTIFFLQEGLTVGGKTLKDFLDAKNHNEALNYIYNFVINEIEFSPSLMKEFNALILEGITEIPIIDALGVISTTRIRPGHYKERPNHVLTKDGSLHTYVEPLLVPGEMDELFDWINSNLSDSSKKLHPVILASIAHYNFVRIHPFYDGNGRGTRILMN